MQFEGEFTTSVPLDRTWQTLLDVETISGCLPGTAGVRETAANQYTGTLTVKLGPISARFELTGVVDASAADHSYQVSLNGRERMTGTLVQATFATQLQTVPEGTHLAYQLDITLRGKLGQLGQAVFQDVAQKMTRQTIACFQERLSVTETGAEA